MLTETQGNMAKGKKSLKMQFNLKIALDDIQIKSGVIDLKSFLGVNKQIAQTINQLCIYETHVNFAETILSGFGIRGSIYTVFNHRRFIKALLEFQSENFSVWAGFFTYFDGRDDFIFRAPSFACRKSN